MNGFFTTFFVASGIVFWIFVGLSVVFVTAVARGVKKVRAERAIGDQLIQHVAEVGAADIERFLKSGDDR